MIKRKSGNHCGFRVYFPDSFIHLSCHRHDPDAGNAVVMIVPPKEHEAKFNPKSVLSKAQFSWDVSGAYSTPDLW